MGWWTQFRAGVAAASYASRLPRVLVREWGRGDFYTPGQIETAVKKAALNPEFIVFGYAAFLPRESFDALHVQSPIALDYDTARNLVRRNRPYDSGNTASDSIMSNGILFGSNGDHSHHHGGHHGSDHDGGSHHGGGFDSGGGGHH
jgi:uncharacterized membrane protein YgcG